MRNDRRELWLDAVIVFAVALAANLIYHSCTRGDFLFPDSFSYLVPARNLLAGRGFVNARGAAETIRTPGYPLMLAALGARVPPMILLQHCLNAAIAVGTLVGARRIGASRLAALAAGLIVALDTPTIHYAGRILSETFFTSVLLGVFLALLAVTDGNRQSWSDPSTRTAPARMRLLVAAAMGTGALVLIRPVAIAACLVFAIWLSLCRIPLRWMLLFVLTALLIPAGWALRNQRRTGVFTVSSIGGTNLLVFRAAGALAMENSSGDFHFDLLLEQKLLLEEAESEIEEELHIPDAEELPHAVLSRHFSRIAIRTIAEHPRGFALLTLRGLAINLFDSRSEAMQMVSRLPRPLVRTALRFWTATMALLAATGLWLLWKTQRRREAVLLAMTIGYFLLISAGGESEARFRVPVIPQEAIAAGAGIEALILLARRPTRPSTVS